MPAEPIVIMQRQEVIVRWCNIHRAILTSTRQALLPYCPHGVARSEPCADTEAHVTWWEEKKTAPGPGVEAAAEGES